MLREMLLLCDTYCGVSALLLVAARSMACSAPFRRKVLQMYVCVGGSVCWHMTVGFHLKPLVALKVVAKVIATAFLPPYSQCYFNELGVVYR
jgi:hypothetical protein